MWRYGGVRLKVKKVIGSCSVYFFILWYISSLTSSFDIKASSLHFEISMLSGIYDLITFEYKLSIYSSLSDFTFSRGFRSQSMNQPVGALPDGCPHLTHMPSKRGTN